MKDIRIQRAYSNLYLSDAMLSLGSLFTYGVYDCGYSIDDVWKKFTASVYGELFGAGSARVISGMSGIEIFREIERGENAADSFPEPNHRLVRDSVFWSGWIMAYYQWYTGQTFQHLGDCIDIRDVKLLYYPMHEADKTKAVELIMGSQGFTDDSRETVK